jgi:hypothetical protein
VLQVFLLVSTQLLQPLLACRHSVAASAEPAGRATLSIREQVAFVIDSVLSASLFHNDHLEGWFELQRLL